MTKIKRPLAFLMSVLMMMTFNFSDGGLALLSLVKSVRAESVAVEPVQPSGEGTANNPYEIESYANLVWFQQKVDESVDNFGLCAKLVADITANENLLDESGEVNGTPNYIWSPICQEASGLNSYTGTFDGAGHSISGLYYNDSTKSNIGLFGKSDGTIKNLIIKDSYFKGSYKIGTFVGSSWQSTLSKSIENCGSFATIVGNNFCCGFIGDHNARYYIKNSYYAGKITATGNYCDAIAKSNGENNFYLSDCGLTSNEELAKSKTKEAFESGEVCYLLNGKKKDGTQAWYQKIGTDSYPILDTSENPINKENSTVYMDYDLDTDKEEYTNSAYFCGDNHKYKNGICKICDALEEPELTDGAYQIANYGNLLSFSEQFSTGDIANNANVTLVADITANENLLNEDGEVNGVPKYNWKPIGSSNYSGTFNGAGHSISGLYVNTSSKVGLVMFLDGTGKIQNLIIKDSYFGGANSGTFAGTLCNKASIIENCSSTATIKNIYDESSFGGIAGGPSTGQIKNCYYAGKLINSSTRADAIAPGNENELTVTNCYYLNGCGATSTVAAAKNLADFSSGEVCYLLNNKVTDGTQAWYQNIGTGEDLDSYPTLNNQRGTVYKDYDEDTKSIKYTNEEVIHAEHKYANGICKICDALKEPDIKDGVYQIANYGNLVWFQKYVDANVSNRGANAILTDDIIANENVLNNDGELNNSSILYTWTPICQNVENISDVHSGTFDGAGHYISGLYYNNSSKSNIGLFGKSKGTIKNLIIKDSYFKGSDFIGTFWGNSYSSSTAENCASFATVETNYSTNIGGISGNMDGTIKNSYYAGKVKPQGNYSFAIKPNFNTYNVTNCYYLYSSSNSYGQIAAKTSAQFASGEVCNLLNNNVTNGTQAWYQNIGTGEDLDSYPTLNNQRGTVYKGYNDETDEVAYINEPYVCTSHKFDEKGFCKKCESPQEPNLQEGVYQISNYGNLVWFQKYVDAGNISASAILVADITANENLTDLTTGGLNTNSPKYTWMPICQDADDSYSGTFDGAGYHISGLYYNDSNKDYAGLFGKSQGTIKNLIIKDSYIKGKNCVGAFVGHNYGNIENCGTFSIISGTQYLGGIAGENDSLIKNCYYAGKIISQIETSDALSYDKDNNGTLTNCYYLNTCGATSEATAKDLEAFGYGEVCYLLNNNVTDGTQAWYQNLGTDSEDDNYPSLNKENGTVYEVEIAGQKEYANAICSHSYENGICEKCNALQKPKKAEDGTIKIANYGNLVWFQKYVDKGNLNANAVLTDDIVANNNLVSETGALNTTSPEYTWSPICQNKTALSNCYRGTFDGNGHYISGLYYNDSSKNYIGLFGKSYSATIKNLIIKDSYFEGKDYIGTFIARCSWDRSISNIIENCGTDAIIKGNAYCYGIGDSYGTITIKNCYYIGKITANTETHVDVFCNSSGTVENCWYLEGCGATSAFEGATAKSASEVANGAICDGVGFHSYVMYKCSICGHTETRIILGMTGLEEAFFMYIPNEIAEVDGAYVKVTFPNGEIKNYSVAQALAADTSIGISEDEKLYRFELNVAPYEFTKPIKAQIFYGDSQSEEFEFNVKDNVEKDVLFDNEAKSVILNYGAAAQKYFNQSTDNLANKDIADTTATIYDKSNIADHMRNKASDPNIGSFTGSDLLLGSKYTLNVYFEPAKGVDEDTLSFTIDDNEVNPEKVDGKYVLPVKDINCGDLDTEHTFKVGTLEMKCSALSYAYSVLNAEDGEQPQELVQLVSALARYVVVMHEKNLEHT